MRCGRRLVVFHSSRLWIVHVVETDEVTDRPENLDRLRVVTTRRHRQIARAATSCRQPRGRIGRRAHARSVPTGPTTSRSRARLVCPDCRAPPALAFRSPTTTLESNPLARIHPSWKTQSSIEYTYRHRSLSSGRLTIRRLRSTALSNRPARHRRHSRASRRNDRQSNAPPSTRWHGSHSRARLAMVPSARRLLSLLPRSCSPPAKRS